MLVAVGIAACLLLIPGTRDRASPHVDPVSAALSVLGLGALVFNVIEAATRRWGTPLVVATPVGSVVRLGGVVLHERQAERRCSTSACWATAPSGGTPWPSSPASQSSACCSCCSSTCRLTVTGFGLGFGFAARHGRRARRADPGPRGQWHQALTACPSRRTRHTSPGRNVVLFVCGIAALLTAMLTAARLPDSRRKDEARGRGVGPRGPQCTTNDAHALLRNRRTAVHGGSRPAPGRGPGSAATEVGLSLRDASCAPARPTASRLTGSSRSGGYDNATVEQIVEGAEGAKVSPSTVFRYFATKEDIVFVAECDPVLEQAIRDRPEGSRQWSPRGRRSPARCACCTRRTDLAGRTGLRRGVGDRAGHGAHALRARASRPAPRQCWS